MAAQMQPTLHASLALQFFDTKRLGEMPMDTSNAFVKSYTWREVGKIRYFHPVSYVAVSLQRYKMIDR